MKKRTEWSIRVVSLLLRPVLCRNSDGRGYECRLASDSLWPGLYLTFICVFFSGLYPFLLDDPKLLPLSERSSLELVHFATGEVIHGYVPPSVLSFFFLSPKT